MLSSRNHIEAKLLAGDLLTDAKIKKCIHKKTRTRTLGMSNKVTNRL